MTVLCLHGTMAAGNKWAWQMKTNFAIRNCENQDDLRLLQVLTAEIWSRHGPYVSLHVGDVVWRYCRHPQPLAATLFPMWFDTGGTPAAYMQYDPSGSADIAIHPDRWSCQIEREVLSVAERKRVESLTQTGMAGGLTVGCLDHDQRREELLTTCGYRDTGRGAMHLIRHLNHPVEDIRECAGYEVRTVDTFENLEAMLDSSLSVPGRDRLDTDRYRRMIGAGFSPVQDVVALDQHRNVVAACIWWYDATNRAGELEPVGCHPEHQRRGLGRAVVCEALRLLQLSGATSAVVYTNNGNAPALKLYESCEFQYVATDRDFHKPLLPVTEDRAGGDSPR